jgi:hypothetical protein
MDFILLLVLGGVTTVHSAVSIAFLPDNILSFIEAGVETQCDISGPITFPDDDTVQVVVDVCFSDRVFLSTFDY